MANFLVETYVPQGDSRRLSIAVASIQTAIETGPGLAGQVRHVRSYLVPRDEMGVHVVEAESAEAVIRLAKIAGIEVERIVTAIGVEPGGAGSDRSDGVPSSDR